MNEQEVFIVAGRDDIYLGTVGEVTGARIHEGGIGISVVAVISDLVTAIAFADGPRIFSIELREPGGT